MIIKNFEELAVTEKKKDCLEILEAGLHAAEPQNIIPKYVTPNEIKIDGKIINIEKYSNVEGTEKAELKGREGRFIYLVGKQKTSAGEVTKFVLIFTEDDVTGVIVANVPQPAIDDGTYSRDSIEAMLLTATIQKAETDAPELFRFSYLGAFRQAYDHGGMTKAYNISGAKPSSGKNRLVKEPLLLVSSSLHGDAMDAKTQATKSFTELGGMKERQIDNQKEVTIGDLKGYQISGEATDAESGDKIAIQLVFLSGEPLGYFMLLGSVPVADREKMMPEIEKVIASFELVK